MTKDDHVVVHHWVAMSPSAVWHLETVRLVTWCFLDVVAVVVECVGGQKGAVIVDGDDEVMVVVSRGCRSVWLSWMAAWW